MRSRILVLAAHAALLTACPPPPDDDPPEPTLGELGGPCFPNLICNTDLVCQEGVCVAEEPGVPTGEEGGPCFGDGTCNEGLECVSALCRELSRPADGGVLDAGLAPPEVSFLATPDAIIEGESVVLSWESSDATVCRLDGELVPVEGTALRRPDEDASYELSCANGAGETTEVVSVLVELAVAIESFTANGQTGALSVIIGDVVTLAWSVSNADRCEILGIGVVTPTDAGQVEVTPQEDTVFTLVCEGPIPNDDSISTSVDVVVQVPVQILSFTGDGTSDSLQVDLGASILLAWSAVGSSECRLSDGASEAGVPPDATQLVSPTSDTTYELVCDGFQGPAASSIEVTVRQPVEILSFTINGDPHEASVIIGEPVDLAWEVANAEACTLDDGSGPTDVEPLGSLETVAADSTSYTLACTGLDGPAVEVVFLTVRKPPVIAGFSIAEPEPHHFKDELHLTWATLFASSCELLLQDQLALPVETNEAAFTHVIETRPVREPPFPELSFTLTCSGEDEPPASQTLTIEVEPSIGAVVLCGQAASASCSATHPADNVDINFATSVRVDGVRPSDGDAAPDLGRVLEVAGDVDFTGSASSVVMREVTRVDGDLVTDGVVTGWFLDRLLQLGGVARHDGPLLFTVQAPRLESVGGVDIRNVTAGCFDWNVGSLVELGTAGLRLAGSLVSLGGDPFSALQRIAGDLNVVNNLGTSNATADTAFAGVSVGGTKTISGNDNIGGCQ